MDSCDRLLAGLIDSARYRIHVAIFSFTSDVLAEALIRAHMRGVEVLVVIELDQASVRGSEYGRLKASGVDVRIDGNPYLMHHKFMVIDDRSVVTGSYNWSAAAEDRNDENLVVIVSEDINHSYESEFQRIWSQASVA
jgi:phosphatidylserine/phosphatidylglycerophosphate/cardiolipin synthase-like enzyme